MLTPPRLDRRWVSAVAVALGLVLAGGWWLCRSDARSNFLPAHRPAEWVLYPTPPSGDALRLVNLSTEFRRSFQMEGNLSPATLSVCSFRTSSIRINGRALHAPEPSPSNWKRVARMDVSRLLVPGTNEISVEVSNSNGPPALWLSLQAGGFSLNSDERWQASFAGGAWRPARLAAKPARFQKGSPLSSTEQPFRCFRTRLPLFTLFFALALAVVGAVRWYAVNRTDPTGKRRAVDPGRALVLLLAALVLAWGVLWWNDVAALPKHAGFDAAEHLAYIQYILDRHALPLANEGWEMYQPPLYYLISASALALLHLSTADPGGILVLRFFGMVCGLITSVMAFLGVRRLFPGQTSTQLFGLLTATLLPVNLYLSFYPTNETLTAALVAASVYVCLVILDDSRVRLARHTLLGLLLGAACLTKASALLACPIILAALAWNLRARRIRGVAQWAQYLGATALVCLAVSGWHYGRAASHFKNPLVGNWDLMSGFGWWQQPGYRTCGYYLRFGECLVHPFYSSFTSLGDGVYSTLWGDGLCGGQTDLNVRTPWNYELMAAGYLLALFPTLLLLTGSVLACVRFLRAPRPQDFAILGLAVLSGIAVLYYSLKVPSYASAKAFYASSAFVPLCVLAAKGWSFLTGKAAKHAWLLWLPLLVWSLNVYGSFWIDRAAPATRLCIARTLAGDGFDDLALKQLSLVLSAEPRNATAAQLTARILAKQGHLPQARELAEKAVTFDPEDAEARLALGAVLSRQGHPEEALAQAQQAFKLAPDHPLAAAGLFVCYYETGRKVEAKAACAESLRVNPFDPEFHRRMAVVSSDLGDPTNAAIHSRLAADLRPPDSRKP